MQNSIKRRIPRLRSRRKRLFLFPEEVPEARVPDTGIPTAATGTVPMAAGADPDRAALAEMIITAEEAAGADAPEAETAQRAEGPRSTALYVPQ